MATTREEISAHRVTSAGLSFRNNDEDFRNHVKEDRAKAPSKRWHPAYARKKRKMGRRMDPWPGRRRRRRPMEPQLRRASLWHAYAVAVIVGLMTMTVSADFGAPPVSSPSYSLGTGSIVTRQMEAAHRDGARWRRQRRLKQDQFQRREQDEKNSPGIDQDDAEDSREQRNNDNNDKNQNAKNSTPAPSAAPTEVPSARPSLAPSTALPTSTPTTTQPSFEPEPSDPPTPILARTTEEPSVLRTTSSPTSFEPTLMPTSLEPTSMPTSLEPTSMPTSRAPTFSPTSLEPTSMPTTESPRTVPTTDSPASVEPTTQAALSSAVPTPSSSASHITLSFSTFVVLDAPMMMPPGNQRQLQSFAHLDYLAASTFQKAIIASFRSEGDGDEERKEDPDLTLAARLITRTVLDSVVRVICRDGDSQFAVVDAATVDFDDADLCAQSKFVGEWENSTENRMLSTDIGRDVTILSTDRSGSSLLALSQGTDEETGLEWIVWNVSLEILQFGTSLLENGKETFVGSVGTEDRSDEPLLEGPKTVSSVQEEAETLFSNRVKDGSFDDLLEDGDYQDKLNVTVASSLEGDEVDLFSNVAATFPAMLEDSPRTETGYTDPLDVEPIHPIRIVGILMLIVTILVVALFARQARRRKREREWDAVYKEQSRGGLETPEGLDHMLDIGRMEAGKAVLAAGRDGGDGPIALTQSVSQSASSPQALAKVQDVANEDRFHTEGDDAPPAISADYSLEPAADPTTETNSQVVGVEEIAKPTDEVVDRFHLDDVSESDATPVRKTHATTKLVSRVKLIASDAGNNERSDGILESGSFELQMEDFEEAEAEAATLRSPERDDDVEAEPGITSRSPEKDDRILIVPMPSDRARHGDNVDTVILPGGIKLIASDDGSSAGSSGIGRAQSFELQEVE